MNVETIFGERLANYIVPSLFNFLPEYIYSEPNEGVFKNWYIAGCYTVTLIR